MNDMVRQKMLEYGISPLPENTTVTMAYVPFQGSDEKMYSPEQAVEAGTLFPCLDKPFLRGMVR